MTINKQLKNISNKKLFTDPYFDVNDEKNCLVKNEVVKWMRPRVTLSLRFKLESYKIFLEL